MDEQKKIRRTKPEKEAGQVSGSMSDRMTYSESIRVNIGQYEHRDIFFSHTWDRKPGETSDESYQRLQRFVRKRLLVREKKIRIQTQEFVDFDTMAKLP